MLSIELISIGHRANDAYSSNFGACFEAIGVVSIPYHAYVLVRIPYIWSTG